jgi:DHA1 family bicyclomycin/chloramphenicol resistance-like MFS transporter
VVFWLPALIAAALTVWAYRRLPETLTPERRRPFTRAALLEGAKAVVSNRQTMCFTLAITFLFGVMTSYLGSSELIVDDVYGYGEYFPAFFAAVGILLAVSALNNARLVGRIGLTVLVRRMAVIGVGLATLLTIVAFTNGGRPNFWLFTAALAITVPLAQGLVPNANTAAMMPMAHVAGTASAIIATITTAGGALLGGLVGGAFDGTVRPFAVGVLVFISISAALILFGATTSDQSGNSTRA